MISIPESQSGKTVVDVITAAALAGGEILKEHFTKDKRITKKGKCNLVSDIDYLAEQQIIRVLTEEYPAFNILAEESSSDSAVKNYTWIIDPLDGTNNYIFGVPFFCATIALVYNQDVLIGVTYDPMRDELFIARQDEDTFLNGVPISVSTESRLEAAMIGLDLGYNMLEGSNMIDIMKTLWGNVHCIRLLGSSALGLAHVAAGRITAYIHKSVYPWDIAAGLLLVNNAGGTISDWNNNPATYKSTGIMAANDKILDKLITYSN